MYTSTVMQLFWWIVHVCGGLPGYPLCYHRNHHLPSVLEWWYRKRYVSTWLILHQFVHISCFLIYVIRADTQQLRYCINWLLSWIWPNDIARSIWHWTAHHIWIIYAVWKVFLFCCCYRVNTCNSFWGGQSSTWNFYVRDHDDVRKTAILMVRVCFPGGVNLTEYSQLVVLLSEIIQHWSYSYMSEC